MTRLPDLVVKAFSRDQYKALANLIAANARDRWPRMSTLMTSDLAWQIVGSDPKANIRLWYQGSELIGYGWFQPHSGFIYDIQAGYPDTNTIAGEMVSWALQRRLTFPPGALPHLEYQSMSEWAEGILNPESVESVGRQLAISVLDSEQEKIRLLCGEGFVASVHYEPYMVHDLAGLDKKPPDGCVIRSIKDSDIDEYLATHAAAWAPSSGLSKDRFAAVRGNTDTFDPNLNLVAEVSPGNFAACAIFWIDAVSRVGSIEPFGTRPEYRGKGISQALIHEGLRQLKAEGMLHARIYTAGFNHQANSLYQSCGFVPVDQSRTYVRWID